MRFTLALVALAALAAHAAELQLDYTPPALPPLPFAGNGTCGPAVTDDTGYTTVTCLGPPHTLSPGQTINIMMLLESPFPHDKIVKVINNTAQLVDETLRPVPLSEVYLHHFGGRFVFGSGAEVRGSFTRKPLPEPYAITFNGTEAASLPFRMTNIQLINSIGVPEQETKRCLECWCNHKSDAFHLPTGNALHGPHHDKGDPTHNSTRPHSLTGSFSCCRQCPTDQPLAGPKNYHLQYTMTFKEVEKEEVVKPVKFAFYDVMGGQIEYDLTEGKGEGAEHVQTYDLTFAADCPQAGEVEIVRCIGHQHFGGKCLSLIDPANNHTICETCPVFGKRKGVAGDEEGYVVRVPDDDLALEGRTYKMKAGSKLRIKSVYDASIPRFGIMGIMFPMMAGLPDECDGNPGYNPNEVFAADSRPNSRLSAPLYGHSMFGVPMGRHAHRPQVA